MSEYRKTLTKRAGDLRRGELIKMPDGAELRIWSVGIAFPSNDLILRVGRTPYTVGPEYRLPLDAEIEVQQELRACPFCDGEAEWYTISVGESGWTGSDRAGIGCVVCPARVEIAGDGTFDQAREAWNQRGWLEDEALVGMLCSVCHARPAREQWRMAICSIGNPNAPQALCRECDLRLNRRILEFFRFPNLNDIMAEYTAAKLAEDAEEEN